MKSTHSNFEYAMKQKPGYTTNCALSLSTPDKDNQSAGRLSLFFKSIRGINTHNLYKYMLESSKENITDLFLLSFHIRDCRGGKGEREIGRQCLVWLFINYPLLFSRVAYLIPEYGRWDDILQFFPGVLDISDNLVSNSVCNKDLIVLKSLQKSMVQMIGSKLKEDLENMNNGRPCSLAAKWAPSQGDSLDRSHNVFKCLADEMGVSLRQLRKKYITPLRSYINIVERLMCDKRWCDIDYSKVPSCTMKKLKKSFEKHDETRFKEWKDALKNGDPTISKVNAKQLQPHELIREIRTNGKADEVCEAQWKIMEEEFMKNGELNNDIAVVDTSFSMFTPKHIPLDVACAMGLLISKCSIGKFKNLVLTFNTTPNFEVINDGTIFDRWKQLSDIEWGGSTNLQATFDLILSRGKEFKLKQEDMPKRLWIISDMQFDKVGGHGDVTNFESIDKKYIEHGFTRPQIVFWNVNGNSTDFPVSVNDNGTALISGYSSSVMKSVLHNNNFSPYQIMRDSLDDTRLVPVCSSLSIL
jgi:hypothetical protein